jgi:hypothetical protein
VKLGFTGTQIGMTDEQRRSFIMWVKTHPPSEFHHGCCLGADEEAWECVSSWADLGIENRPVIVAHPPKNRSFMSVSALDLSDEKRKPDEYLVRNANIVNACDVLAACPKGPEETRSGTWSTVRRARRARKPVVIFWPDGRVETERFTEGEK